ncbi:MAG: T9SS type A sorting domain-containing protein [Bacteroidota bacterium]
MKKELRYCCLLFVMLAFTPNRLKAAHLFGTEITYACTSTPGLFEITYIFYRECNGVPACSGGCGAQCSQTLVLMGADPSCYTSSYGSFILTLQNVRDVGMNSVICPSAKNTCPNMGCTTPGSFTPAIERYEFKGFVNIGTTSGIPSGCCNVRIVNEQCCRTFSSINNTNASGSNYYNEAVINRCLSVSPCNSSPAFTNEPLFLACGGESIIYNNGLKDPEADSLSISFAPVLVGFNTTTSYIAPFTYDKPMPWTGAADGTFPSGISCNSVTGDVMFTPGNSGSTFNGVVIFACSQWKKINGTYQLLGTVRRECIMTLTGNCISNIVPDIRTNPINPIQPNQPKTNWIASAGKQLCFNISARDTTIDTTFLSWNKALSKLGATFTPTYDSAGRFNPVPLGGPREDQYQFCWTPDDSVANGSTYYFNVLAYDNRCPIRGKMSRTFGIQVLQKPELQIQQITSACNQKQFSYTNTKPYSKLDSVEWRVTKNLNDTVPLFLSKNNITPFYSFMNAGKYYVRLLTFSQPNIQTLIMDSFFAPVYTFRDSVFGVNAPACHKGDNGSFSVKGLGGISPYSYSIVNDIFQSSSLFSQLPAGNYLLTIKDAADCLLSKTIAVPETPPFTARFTLTEPLCFQSDNGTISVSLNNGTAPFQYKLDNLSFQTSFVFPQVSAGTHTVAIKDKNNCSITDSIYLNQPQDVSFTYTSVKPFCAQTFEGKISMTAYGGIAPHTYKINLQPFTNNNIFDSLRAGNYSLSVMDSNGCTFSNNITLNAISSLSATTTHTTPTCFARNDGTLQVTVMGGSTPYTYKIGNGGYDSSNLFTHLPSGTHLITVKDFAGCTFTLNDTLQTPAPISSGSITGDSAVTKNNAYTYEVAVQQGLMYHWMIEKGSIVFGQQTPEVIVRWDTMGSGRISVIVFKDSLCGDTSSQNVNIGNTGINDLSTSTGIMVYPNPATTWIEITLKTLPENNHLYLYNLQGKLILHQELKLTQQLNLDELPQGIYMLRVGDWYGKVVRE